MPVAIASAFRAAAAGDDQIHVAAENHIGGPILRKYGKTLHFARSAPGRFDAPAAVRLLLVERNVIQPLALISLPTLVAHDIRRQDILQYIAIVIVRAGGFILGVDRIAHAENIRQTAALGVRTLPVTALSLRIARTVFRIEKIRHSAVHVPIDELESRAGISDINFHVGLRNGTGADLARDGLHEVVLQQRFIDGAQILVILHPVRLDGLDPVARSQQDVVEICGRNDSEGKPLGALRNRGEQVHAIQDTRTRCRAQAPEDRPRGIQPHGAIGCRSHRRKAHLSVTGDRKRTIGVRSDGRHGFVQRRVLLGDADGLARDDFDLLLRELHIVAVDGRTFGLRTEKSVFFLVQQVVDTLVPIVRFVHPYIAVATRQHRRCGQRCVVRIGIAVRILVVQRKDGNFSRGSLLSQTTMTLRENAGDMAARNIRRIELVTRPVVEIRDVRRVGNRIVELDARPCGLRNRQFREVCDHSGVFRRVHVAGQAAASDQTARRRIAALLVHAAHRRKASKQRPVVLDIDARHTQVLHRRAAGKQLLPVDQRAAVDHQTCNRCRTLKYQSRVREAVQTDQFQRLQRSRQGRRRQRRARGEGDAPQRSVPGYERLQFQVIRQVQRSEAGRFQPRDIQRAQTQTVRDNKCGERRLALGATHVQGSQRRAIVQIQRLQQRHRDVRQIKTLYPACTVEILRVVHDQIRIHRQLYRAARIGRKHRRLLRSAARITVAEIVAFRCRDTYLTLVLRELVAEVGREAVGPVRAGNVLRIEQREAVADRIDAVRVAAALQCVQVVVAFLTFGGRDSIRQWLDVFEVTVLVVDTLRPVTHLLLIEHPKHIVRAHIRAQRARHLDELRTQALAHQLPQHAVMAGESVRTDAAVERFVRDRIEIGEQRVVAAAENRIEVVRQRMPDKTVPCGEHHVLRTVVDGHQVIREEIPRTEEIDIEIPVDLRGEPRGILLATFHPRPEALYCGAVVGMRRRPRLIRLVAELQRIVEGRHVVRRKQAQRSRVVQELQAQALVALLAQRRRVVEALDSLETVDVMALRLLVVEVEFPEIARRAAAVVVVEPVAGEPVDADAHIVRTRVGPLRRREIAAFAVRVGDQPHGARVVRRRGVREVRFQTEDRNRTRARLERILQIGDIDAVHLQRRAVLIPPIEIQTVVLARIGRRGGSLNAQPDIAGHEVVLLAVGRVEVEIDRNLELLVVRLVDQLHIADDAENRLALRTELFDAYVVALVVQHIVLAVELHHLLGSLPVDDVVREHLVIRQGAVVDTQHAQIDIGGVRSDTDTDRRCLQQTLRCGILLGAAANAVHIEFEQPVAGFRTDDEADLQIDIRSELRTHLGTARGGQLRLLCRNAEPDAIRHARKDLSVAVGDVRAAQLELVGGAFRGGVCSERLHPDLHARAVAHPQHIARPAAAAPVETLERTPHVAVTPRRRIGLRIAAPCGRQPQTQPRRRLLDVDIGRFNRHGKNVFDAPAEKTQRDRALCGEAINIVLCRARDTHVLCQHIVLVDRNLCRSLRGIVGNEVERQLFIAVHAQTRRQVVVREDTTVREAVHRSDKRTARTASQNVEVDTLRTQRRLFVHGDLGDHLDGMTAGRKPRHRKREAPVRRARFRDGSRIALAAVHVERDDLRAGTAYREGDHGRILRSVTACGESRRKVVTTRKRQRDDTHRNVRLLRLLPPRLRIDRRSPHVNVRNTGLQVGSQVERIAAFRDILNRRPECLDRTARGRNPNRRLLAGGSPGFIARSILMVVGVGQPHRVSLLDDRAVDRGAQHDLRRGALTAASAASGRKVYRGDLRAALVRERQMYARLVVAQVGRHVEDRIRIDLVQATRDGGVLHRIRRLRIQRLIDRRHGDIDIAVAVGTHLRAAVHRDAPHTAAELPPLRRIGPILQRGADELVALPLFVADGERQDQTARLCFLPLDGGKSRCKRIVTVVERQQRRHVVYVSRTRAAAEPFPKRLVRPVVERRSDELARLPLGRIDTVGDDQTLLAIGDAVVEFLCLQCCQRCFQRIGRIATTGIDIEQRRAAQRRFRYGVKLCNDTLGCGRRALRLGRGCGHTFGQLAYGACDILRFRCSILCPRSGCNGHSGGIFRRFRQQRYGNLHHLRALHGRKRVHTGKRRHLFQLQNALR